MLQYDPDAFVINSFSKYYGMPGWRLGWIVCPPDLVAEARARIGNLFLSPPALRQQAAPAAFDCEDGRDARVAMYLRHRELPLNCPARINRERDLGGQSVSIR